MKISNRLKFIESICDKCDTFADIGTDHGYVPYLMLKDNKVKKIIATDVRINPINSAKENLSKFEQSKIDFRVGYGLSAIDYNEAEGICICGMGYDLIKDILSSIELYNFKYLIVSPHTKQKEFEKFILSKKLFYILYIIEDNKKTYYIYKIRKSIILNIKDKIFK